MWELEKILEELNEEIRASIPFSIQRADGLRQAREIIRKHMNDGWIPVEEALPKTDEIMLVTCQTKKGVLNTNRAYYHNGFWHGSGSMSGVIAWQPSPEPYKAERSE